MVTPAPLVAQASEPAHPLAEALTLEPGASCLDRDRLTERVIRWRERATMDDEIQVQVRGDAHVATRIYFSVLRTGTPPTERVLDNAPTDCDQLHSAVALSIALAIDALLAGEVAARTPMPAAPTPPQPSAAATPHADERSHQSIELGLLAGASVGVVPSTAIAVLPRVSWSPLPWLSLAVAGIATRADTLALAGTPGSFDASVLGVGGDACFGGEPAERVSFFSCTGIRGGVFLTEGRYVRERAASRRWWAVAVSGQARAWILPSVALGISVEALFTLAARDLVVESTSPTQPPQHSPISRFGLSISGGPVFRFF